MRAVNLSDLLPDVRKVNIGKGDVEVFSLDITDVGILLEKYGNQLGALFQEGTKPNFAELAKSMPEVITDVLVMGLHAAGQEDSAARIPLSAKVEILAAIWELSVTDPKKLVAKLKELAEGAKALRATSEA